MADFSRAVEKTLKHEGGFAIVEGSGEVVNFGITHWFLRSIGASPSYGRHADRDVPASEAEILRIRNLKRWEAVGMYHEFFWVPNRLSAVEDQRLAEEIFDVEVNTGKGVLIVQRAANRISPLGKVLDEDDILGPATLRVLNSSNHEDIVSAFHQVGSEYYIKIAEKNPRLAGNLKGWLARLHA